MTVNWLKEPLLHFVLMAALVFYFSDRIWPDEYHDVHQIKVSKEDLIRQLEYQVGVFDRKITDKHFSSMPSSALTGLIHEFVTEEVLYREAISLGLDQNDRAIRLRLGQQVELLLEDLQETSAQVTDASLEQYFNNNIDEFLIDGSTSFRHLFFNQRLDKNKPAELPAKERAQQHLRAWLLSSKQSPPPPADRFLYHSYYVDRTVRFIQSHFGAAFTERVFSADMVIDRWSAPIESKHGYHLVFITKKLPDRVPEFNEVKGPVLTRFLRDQRGRIRVQKLALLIDKYQVKLPDEIEFRLAK